MIMFVLIISAMGGDPSCQNNLGGARGGSTTIIAAAYKVLRNSRIMKNLRL